MAQTSEPVRFYKMQLCKYLPFFLLSLICGCAVLTKQSHLSADLSSAKELSAACDQQQLERAFHLNIGNEKILVNIKQENEQEWVGPVVLPLVPKFGSRVWIAISSNKSKTESANFSGWKLAINGQTFTPIHVMQEVEKVFNYKSLTTLVFKNDALEKAKDFELLIPGIAPIKLHSRKNWNYLPLVGGMPEPIGRCGIVGLPEFSLDRASPGLALIYFYRVESAQWTGRKPDVLLDYKKLFEAETLRYKKIELPPGHHKLAVNGGDMGSQTIDFDTAPNNVYFVRYSAGSTGLSYLNSQIQQSERSEPTQLKLVSKDTAIDEIGKLRAAD